MEILFSLFKSALYYNAMGSLVLLCAAVVYIAWTAFRMKLRDYNADIDAQPRKPGYIYKEDYK